MTTMKKNSKATTVPSPIFVNCSEVHVFRMSFSSCLIWFFALLAASSSLRVVEERRGDERWEKGNDCASVGAKDRRGF